MLATFNSFHHLVLCKLQFTRFAKAMDRASRDVNFLTFFGSSLICWFKTAYDYTRTPSYYLIIQIKRGLLIPLYGVRRIV